MKPTFVLLPLSATKPASTVGVPVWFLPKYKIGSSIKTLEVSTVNVVPCTVKSPPTVTLLAKLFTPDIFWSPVLNTT